MDGLLGQLLDGRYRLVERLGEGEMGVVYRAEPPEGPSVAVKVLSERLVQDAGQRERFQREARALFGLQHPHILAAHDFGVVAGRPYLVMELLQGRLLEEIVDAHGSLPPERAVELMAQVLDALAFAHGQGAVHRDLKAGNVFVVERPGEPPVAKLLDFGLVKFIDEQRWGSGGPQLTAFGSIFGTPAYMAPEQAAGATADARADVYAAGVLLFELLTGRWPFEEEDRLEMMRAHLMRPPPTLTERHDRLRFREELEAVVARALAKEKGERFADAGEMLAALRAVPTPLAVPREDSERTLEAGAIPPEAASSPRVRPGGGQRRLLLWLGGVAFGLTVALGFALWLARG